MIGYQFSQRPMFNAVSLEESLAVVEPHLLSALHVSEKNLSSFRSIARIFPDCFCKILAFETRLWDEGADSDFIVMIPKDDSVPIPGEFGRRILLSEEARRSPEWRKVLGFLSDWADPTSALYEHVGAIWLEFDVERGWERTPLPGLFFGGTSKPLCKVPAAQVIRAGLESLEGRPLCEDLIRKLTFFLSEVPDTAHITQVGSMLPRPFPHVKLYVGGLDNDEIVQYLSRIGWKGPHDTVRTFLSEASRLVECFHLALEFGVEIDTSMGIECYVSPWKPYLDYLIGSQWALVTNYVQYSRESSLTEYIANCAWRPLFDYLVGKGLCRGSYRDAVLTWSESPFKSSDAHEGKEPRPRRYINHVKVGCSVSGEFSSKAYFMYGSIYPQMLYHLLS